MSKKKSSKPTKKGKSSGGEILVVQSKVREFIKSVGDYNIGSDLVGSVSSRVEELLSDAARRAQENGRKTIQGRDM